MTPAVLISPNAYKGTLSPLKAATLIKSVFKKSLLCPLADGGDGTLDVLRYTLKGKLHQSRVRGPLGTPVSAKWGIVTLNRKKTAIIEMARASGLALVRGKNRILAATTYGTGQLIKAALNKRCRQIVMGVGGTATGEGGAGALEALGLRYYDRKGNRLSSKPTNLIHLNKIDWTGLDPRLKKTKIVILCDVRNPLLGSQGSAKMFAPQKGATPSQVRFLESMLTNWSRFAKIQTKNKPGAGSAGALAFGLSGFVGAKLVEGTPFIMKTVGWKSKARKAKWIITGEGRLDQSSFSGKVIGSIVKKKGRSKVAVLCGSSALSSRDVRKRGISVCYQMKKRGLRKPHLALKQSANKLKLFLRA